MEYEALSTGQTATGSTLSFHDIEYTVKVKEGKCGKVDKVILKEISGIFMPGMNAIMGPTGGGKTSLLDVLAARKDASGLSGKVLIDSKPQPSNFRLISGYVVQDDIIMGTLSVRENLTFSAALRLPSSVGKKERAERVEDVISELGLQDCADTRVGDDFKRGVSGGERKRTNIGMELIIKPTFLFVDEPTTGLDASTAQSVMTTMKQLSQRGRTIIFSIHQPRYSIYRLFDKLHLLSKGNTVYHGPASDALQYFAENDYICKEHDNPADFFLDSILHNQAAIVELSNNNSEGKDVEQGSLKRDHLLETELKEQTTPLKDCFKKSKYYSDMTHEVKSILERSKGQSEVCAQEEVTYQTSFLTQFIHTGRRAFINYIRDFKLAVKIILMECVFAIITGGVYFQLDDGAANAIQDRTGALFIIVAHAIVRHLEVVDAFISEQVLFLHESISGYYRTSAYFLAKLIGDLIPQRTAPVLVKACIVYWMIGLRPGISYFLMFTLNLLLTTYATCSLYFFVGTFFRTFTSAQALLQIFAMTQVLFSGFFINIESTLYFLAWMEYFSIARYSMKAATILEFHERIFCDPGATNVTSSPLSSDEPTCLIGDKYLELQGIDHTDWAYWMNELVLAIIAIVFMFLAYLRLRFMKKLK